MGDLAGFAKQYYFLLVRLNERKKTIILGVKNMSFISKVELKSQLQKMGVNVVKGNYVQKSDVETVLATMSRNELGEKLSDYIGGWSGEKYKDILNLLGEELSGQLIAQQDQSDMEKDYPKEVLKNIKYNISVLKEAAKKIQIV